MPGDHSVTATFNPPDGTSWSFSPQKVSMNGAGKIKIDRSTMVTPAWVFSDAQPNLPSWCTFTVKAGGAMLEIDDNGQSTNGQYVSYTVNVTWNGTTYTSPATAPPAAGAPARTAASAPAPTRASVTADGGTGIPPMIMNE